MRPALRNLRAAVFVVLVACVVAACGGDEGAETTPGSTATTPEGGTATANDGSTEDTRSEDEDLPPTAADVAAGRGLARLAKAFAPVSARINFLVTAETLRADAVEADAGEKVEGERAGRARIEAVRLQGVLAKARPRVAAVPVRTVAQQQVQQLLLEAIDVRTRATNELLGAIRARGSGLGDSVVKERFATWRASWDESIRATREATTTTQEALAELGLPPAREEALR
ncbi:MAG: hypothetical protein JWL76_850 [Thermoleophilia bacterium]|nr:hypothetical protein [Thermoleophilia bacterium]